MSKIFEALKHSGGEAAETVFPALEQTGENIGNLVSPDAPSTATQVVDSPVSATPIVESPVTGAAVSAIPLNVPPVLAARTGTDSVPQYRVERLQVRESSPVLPFDNTNIRASEQYRIIRTRIIQHPAQQRMIVISITGPGDVKTITPINIAGALSL